MAKFLINADQEPSLFPAGGAELAGGRGPEPGCSCSAPHGLIRNGPSCGLSEAQPQATGLRGPAGEAAHGARAIRPLVPLPAGDSRGVRPAFTLLSTAGSAWGTAPGSCPLPRPLPPVPAASLDELVRKTPGARALPACTGASAHISSRASKTTFTRCSAWPRTQWGPTQRGLMTSTCSTQESKTTPRSPRSPGPSTVLSSPSQARLVSWSHAGWGQISPCLLQPGADPVGDAL